MTRVLHTADVHLTPDDPARQEALGTLLGMADEEDVDVVTIGGDLFDTPDAVEQLRPAMRNDLFSDRPFEILLIPGNHDVEAFRGDVFFGDACTVLLADPFEHYTAPGGDLRITGLPYRERPDDDLLLALEDREPFAGAEALLLHCSLDAPFDDYETGDEGTRRYFPVTEAVLSDLGFDFYLAGHYHSPHKVSVADGAEFTYPGTPASTSRAETGRRRVSLLDSATGIDVATLDTFHYAHRTFTATPGEEDALLESVRDWAKSHAVESADASVRVTGYVAMDEDAFHEDLAAAAAPAAVTDETRGVERLLAHPLFQDFEAERDAMDWDEETADRVTERTLAVFNRLSVRGEL